MKFLEEDPGCMAITKGGYRAAKIAVQGVVSELTNILPDVSSNQVAVLQLLDNIAYSVLTTDDIIIPCGRNHSGHYLVDGDLMLPPPPPRTPPPISEKLLAHLPVAKKNLKLVTVPLPRYFTAACCSVPEHTSNRG
jgi:hypothetical protein